MTLVVRRNEFPVVAQYESDRRAVLQLMSGLQRRIRLLEQDVAQGNIQRLESAGSYELRIAELAEELERQRGEYERVDQVAKARFDEMEQLRKEVGGEKERILSLELQLNEKREQVALLTEQFKDALQRSEALQKELLEMGEAHQRQIEENNRVLAAATAALKGRNESRFVGEGLSAVVNEVVNTVAAWLFCKPAKT